MGASASFSRRLAVLLASATLAGCGFQMRGATSLPEGIESIHLRAPTVLSEDLTVLLEGGGLQVTPARADADAVLTVSEARFDKRVLSVDPNTGKEREFEIAYAVTFSMTGTDGTTLVPTQEFSLLRDYVFDRDAVIGKSREESTLRREMQRDAAQQMLRRIDAFVPQ